MFGGVLELGKRTRFFQELLADPNDSFRRRGIAAAIRRMVLVLSRSA